MTFEKFLFGGSLMCYAPDSGEGDGGGGSGGGDGDAGDSGDNGDAGAGDDNGSVEGGDAGGDGKKDGDSLLGGLDDGDGLTFDFTKGEKPEGFPDEYWDAEKNGVNAQALWDSVQKQEKIAKDLRAKMGKGEHKPPEKADQYKFDPSEKAAEFIKDDDPLVAAAKEIAHKHGLSQDQYAGFMAEISDRMVDIANEMGDPENATEEQKAASEAERAAYIKKEIEAIGPNGPQVLRAVQSWGREMLADGTFSEADVQTLESQALVSADMVKLFNRIRSRMGGGEIPGTTFDDGLPPDQEIAEKMNNLYEAAKKSGNSAEYDKYVNDMTEKRRRAGRGERLQF